MLSAAAVVVFAGSSRALDEQPVSGGTLNWVY